MTRPGLLIILSSPSGAGKSTLARRLLAADHAAAEFSVSATTRLPRDGEIDGKDYHFLSIDAFQEMVADGAMLEHALVFGNYYGSPAAPVAEAIAGGTDVIFDIDWQGAQQIKQSTLKDNVLSVFILPPSISELRRRLETRAKDAPDVVARRMQKSWDEISHWDGYDYVLVNDDIDDTFSKLETIVRAERMRRARQPQLMEFVRGLQSEFEGRER
ncbi:MAG: guanylate kinase [Pseudomonadota bacterium]